MTGRLAGNVVIATGAGCVGPGWGNGRAIYEIGLFVDPTRSTRVGASGSRYADTYGDGKVTNNYAVLVSAWLFF
jgi:hypothetical protein